MKRAPYLFQVRRAKEELDQAVPKTVLLDVSAARQKADLAARALVNRVLPSLQALKLNLESHNLAGFDASRFCLCHLHGGDGRCGHHFQQQRQQPQYWNVPGVCNGCSGANFEQILKLGWT
jgi:hypothetical protein